MSHVYILRDKDRNATNMVKIGITSDSKEELESRYNTYIPDVKILLYLKCKNAEEVEKKILDIYSKYRVPNNRGNFTEWLYISRFKIQRGLSYDTLEDAIRLLSKQ